ncbi:MFS transporter small subunit [Paeniglutamicibacter terrestris]|uniref:Uncharacterized protein n=1 Tax=Paeniglutamicibacter terrestris TaxID=2723403 RepID=A0ABX1G3P2_9MICC|nr:hypothetical protein [Paeniglutamicibacter terrestris]NKG20849.1 hypothetical protein [Paeniglutamicibacter terrestris]
MSQNSGNLEPIDAAGAHDVQVDRAVLRLVFGWALVGVPLGYGVITTLSRVAQLFN